jgi:hypothetical protein
MLKDPALQFVQLATRLEPELVAQSPTHVSEEVERLCLPTAAIEGEHQLCLHPLTHRMS